MTRKERLVESFNEAIAEGSNYIFIEVNFGTTEYPATELIVNPIENAPAKIAYIEKTYTDNLGHPHAPIYIESFGYVQNLSQLEYQRHNFKELN